MLKDVWSPGPEPIQYDDTVDPRSKNLHLVYLVQWPYTANPRVLEMPAVFRDSCIRNKLTQPPNTRREAELDDYGVRLPWDQTGPDIYFTVRTPPGWHQLSLYNYNKDGHWWAGSCRDWRISIVEHAASDKLDDVKSVFAAPELRIPDYTPSGAGSTRSSWCPVPATTRSICSGAIPMTRFWPPSSST